MGQRALTAIAVIGALAGFLFAVYLFAGLLGWLP
jgi:hypothetical protein